jgi:hypothetical protein
MSTPDAASGEDKEPLRCVCGLQLPCPAHGDAVQCQTCGVTLDEQGACWWCDSDDQPDAPTREGCPPPTPAPNSGTCSGCGHVQHGDAYCGLVERDDYLKGDRVCGCLGEPVSAGEVVGEEQIAEWRAEVNGPGWFWTRTEWAEWSNELAMILPEDAEEWPGVNADGAQESVIAAALRHLVAEVARLRAQVAGASEGVVVEETLLAFVASDAVQYALTLAEAGHRGEAEARLRDAAANWPTTEDYGDGCDCTELCSMGPTCPGGMLARLPGAGCWRSCTCPTNRDNLADYESCPLHDGPTPPVEASGEDRLREALLANDELHALLREAEAENAALRERVEAVEAALADAIKELVECRSFISVETRHYPTVTAINEKIETLRAALDAGATT